jgi:hypothetical protein
LIEEYSDCIENGGIAEKCFTYQIDSYLWKMALIQCFLNLLSFLPPFIGYAYEVVIEKEERKLEYMKMMGMRFSSNLVSWFISYCCSAIFGSFVIAMFTSYGIFGERSNTGLFFFMAFSYSVSQFGFATLLW